MHCVQYFVLFIMHFVRNVKGDKMGEFNQKKYIEEYRKENYKRVPLDIRKDEYEKMLEHARAKGFSKFNAYIKDLIYKDMEQSKNITTGDVIQQGNNNTIHIG